MKEGEHGRGSIEQFLPCVVCLPTMKHIHFLSKSHPSYSLLYLGNVKSIP